MAFFTYRGYQCFYYRMGDPEETKLVLIPDDGESSASVTEFAATLAPRFTTGRDLCIYQVDFLGCGQSETPRSFVSDIWEDQAMQIKALFEQDQIEQAILVAFGAGGCRTAMAFLAAAPAQVETVYLVGITAEEAAAAMDGAMAGTGARFAGRKAPRLADAAASMDGTAADSAEEAAGAAEDKVRLMPPSMVMGSEANQRVLAAAVRQLIDGEACRCPYCGGLMLRGYMQGGYRDTYPVWNVAIREEKVEDPGHEGLYHLRNLRPKNFAQKYLWFPDVEGQRKTAWVCKACKKLIADVEEAQ